MDGARFANALVSLGCSPAEITWKAGVDALSFGATKNGVLAAEAANPVAVAERWNDYGAAQVLGWLIRILARTIRVKLGGAGGLPHKSRNIGHLQQIANELHLHQLVDFHDLILRNYQVLTGPFNINSQALLEEVVIQWQSVQGQRRGGVK